MATLGYHAGSTEMKPIVVACYLLFYGQVATQFCSKPFNTAYRYMMDIIILILALIGGIAVLVVAPKIIGDWCEEVLGIALKEILLSIFGVVFALAAASWLIGFNIYWVKIVVYDDFQMSSLGLILFVLLCALFGIILGLLFLYMGVKGIRETYNDVVIHLKK